MKKVSVLTGIIFTLVFASVLSGHELINRNRFTRLHRKNSQVPQRMFYQGGRSGEWIYPDYFWLTGGGEDNIDDLLDINVYPIAKMLPEFSFFVDSFDDWIFKPWDGWATSTVTCGDYHFTCTHDTAGRLTEYAVKNDCKVDITYNDKGDIATMDWYSMDGSTSRWDDIMKDVFRYNSVDQWTELLSTDIDPTTGDTLDCDKSEITYDAQGNLIENVYSYFDEASGTYKPMGKAVLKYNALNQIIEETTLYWDETSGTWVDEAISSKYSYDQNGFLNMATFLGNDSAFYAYNASGKIAEVISFLWNDPQGIWEGDYKETATYNAQGNLSEWNGYAWDKTNSVWVPEDKWILTYHANGNLNEVEIGLWDVDSTAYLKSKKHVCTYDAKDNPKRFTTYTYNETTQDWEVDKEYTISFASVNIQKPKTILYNDVNVSYRANNRFFSAKIDGRPLTSDKLQVFDLQGRMLTELKPVLSGGYSVYTWDYSDKTGACLTQKVFLIAIRKGDMVVTQKVTPLLFR